MAERRDVVHLLRRTEFVARPARVDELLPLSLDAAVDDVLDVGPHGLPLIPPNLLVDDPDHRWEQFRDGVHWWADTMLTWPRPVLEKMALFWHGHFVSALFDGVDEVPLMMRQIHLYRQHALGDFRVLTQQMAVDPAMLLYLSNATNVAGAPNENFARELMELFTIGVGLYTEVDVAASARAWTGHNYDETTKTYVFRPDRHDGGAKTFLGVTRNWDGPEIIDALLRDDLTTRRAAARFIARKLWELFAYVRPDDALVGQLADVFLGSDLSIRALVRAILTRPEFYSDQARQGLVRTPVEYAVAVMHHAGVTAAQIGLAGWAVEMGQIPLNPPNVSGWRSNEYWLSTSAIGGRAGLARGATLHLRDDAEFDHLHFADHAAAVDEVAARFGVAPLSDASRAALIAAFANEPNRWWAVTNLLTMTMLTPEFHVS